MVINFTILDQASVESWVPQDIVHKSLHNVFAFSSIVNIMSMRGRTDYDYVWFLEQDTAWNGNLFELLDHFNMYHVDYITAKTQHRWHGEWPVALEHTGKGVFNDTLGASRPFAGQWVVRYSRSFVEKIQDEWIRKGIIAWNEWYTSIICKEHMDNCKLFDMCIETPYVCGEPFQVGGEPKDWVYDPNAQAQFFHPIKH